LADAQDELLDELARPAVAARGVEQALAQQVLADADGEVLGLLHARSVEETQLDPPTLRVRGPCGGSGDAPETPPTPGRGRIPARRRQRAGRPPACAAREVRCPSPPASSMRRGPSSAPPSIVPRRAT